MKTDRVISVRVSQSDFEWIDSNRDHLTVSEFVRSLLGPHRKPVQTSAAPPALFRFGRG